MPRLGKKTGKRAKPPAAHGCSHHFGWGHAENSQDFAEAPIEREVLREEFPLPRALETVPGVAENGTALLTSTLRSGSVRRLNKP